MKMKKVKKLERRSIVCSKREKNKQKKENHEKKEEKKRKNQRLTYSSHMLITHFWYWTFKLDPKPLDTFIIP
jgi:DNA-nicking Smr family endonuclease